MFTKGMTKTGGRQKGTPNKLTSTFREAVLLAYDHIGGHEAFSQWAAENRTEFYKIAARLIPLEIKAPGDDKLIMIVDRGRGLGGQPKGEPLAITDQSQTGLSIPDIALWRKLNRDGSGRGGRVSRLCPIPGLPRPKPRLAPFSGANSHDQLKPDGKGRPTTYEAT